MEGNEGGDSGASEPRRAASAALAGIRKAARAFVFLCKIVLPVTLLVAVLGWSGALAALSAFLAPVMRAVGLPGDAALAFISSVFMGLYSAIAVSGSIALDIREATVLAVMCLTAHNLPVETAVMRKTGSSAAKMAALRIGVAVAAGWLLNAILPESLSARAFAQAAIAERLSFLGMLGAWAASTAALSLRMAAIVLAIMVAQSLLDEYRVLEAVGRRLAPLMRLFGLAERSSTLWIVSNTVGYAYGAGIILEEVGSGKLGKHEGDLFNHHAAISHSLLEDTALYAALGCPLFWLTVPRLAFAAAVVWLERLRRRMFRSSFKIGTM